MPPQQRCAAPDWWAVFGESLARLAVPVAGSLDLTHRCNLSCAHCYLGSYRQSARAGRPEMDSARRLRLLDELAQAGCLYLLISGGEPLLHPDFAETYLRAKRNGMLVTVFTNGTLLDCATADLFAEWPPQLVEISLYGAGAATYEAVTGVAGSFERCLAGVALLRERGVAIALKTMLLTLNRHEFDAIAGLAAGLGVRFRFDPAVTPRFDGDRAPARLRVDPAEVARHDFADPERARSWVGFAARWGDAAPRTEELYQCGAARTSFYVAPSGVLQPCLMLEEPACDLTQRDFDGAWRYIRGRIGSRLVSPANRCHRCPERALCGYCPGFMRLETGDEETASPYLCGIGAARRAAIRDAAGGA